MKPLPRDLVYLVNFSNANAVRRTFIFYTLFFCFAFILFYRSNLVHSKLGDGYGKIIEVFGSFGPFQEAFWCNRSDRSYDVCHISGDVHLTTGDVSSVTLYSRPKLMKLSKSSVVNCSQHVDEVIRPYARKFENSTMELVQRLELKCADGSKEGLSRSRFSLGTGMGASCKSNQTHSAPAVLFSTGGFCGNPFHDFREVVIPLFITAQHYKGDVVLLISDIRPFWVRRWMKVLQHMSRYPLVNIQEPSGEHCFRQMTVGLITHNKDFALTPSLMPKNETIEDFQRFLREALAPRGSKEAPAPSTPAEFTPTTVREGRVPKLLILVRQETRVIRNLDEVRNLALGLGFDVQVAKLYKDLDLQTIYEWFYSSDVVMGAHGSELAYMPFMRKKTVLIQIVPIGTDWPSTEFFGKPAEGDLGLHYLEYKIKPNESTLADKYGVTDRIVVDPWFYVSQGWEYEYRIYLSEQSVRPAPENLRDILVSARALVQDLPADP